MKRIENTSVHQMTSYYFIVNSLLILNNLPEEIKQHVTEYVVKNAVIEQNSK